jgi:myosin-5
VLDLIDQRHTGILSLLDEQCIVPQSNDQKLTRYLYAKCDKHVRFSATATQKSVHKFSIEHYAGPVEYTTDLWLEKNKDQLPAATAELFSSSTFDLIHKIKPYIRVEQRKGGGGSIACKSVGAQFSSQLRALRTRIDTTSPHYVRCLKPNDDLIPHSFEPKNIVEQLRCGGVLEAVRVSRAGYPTRYHHEVFLRRYYLLGNRTETSSNKGKSTKSLLKSLIEQITYDVWVADLNLIKSLRAAEKYASSPVKKVRLFCTCLLVFCEYLLTLVFKIYCSFSHLIKSQSGHLN